MADHGERSTVASCIASVLGVPVADVPLDDENCRAWLAERGVGMAPIADASSFAWAGPWVAMRPSLADGEPRAVVMFGVPSGVIWIRRTSDEVLAGFLVAPLDVAGWAPPETPAPGDGVVEAILVAPTAGASVVAVGEVKASSDAGLEGDRYATGTGTFASGRPGAALTLIAAEVLEDLERAFGQSVDHRRNVVTRGIDLNALVGRRFRLGELLCAGRRLCQPCAHLDRLNGGGVLRPLVNRGGLRADIVTDGVLRVGDDLSVA